MDRILALFRSEALRSVRTSSQGQIILIRPISFSYMSMIALMIALAIIAFFVTVSYTKRSTLNGQLAPDLGLLKVYAPQLGTILEKHVVEGAAVKEGDVLFVLTSERRSTALGDGLHRLKLAFGQRAATACPGGGTVAAEAVAERGPRIPAARVSSTPLASSSAFWVRWV